MPNYCSNTLTVTGPEADVAVLVDSLLHGPDGNPQILPSLVPMPAELTGTRAGSPRPEEEEDRARLMAAYGAADWYDWAVANWGTKWPDVDTVQTERSPGLVVYGFETAWAPPIAGVTTIATLFPSLTFTLSYEEPGMAFAGEAEWINAELVKDDSWDMDMQDYEEDWAEPDDEDRGVAA